MKCLTFGTVRMDIHIFSPLSAVKGKKEIKTDKMIINAGGSVFNTARVLSAMKRDVEFFMPSTDAAFEDFIMSGAEKLGLPCHQIREENSTAASIIFLDDTGEKNMVSFDGARKDGDILDELSANADGASLFYTSFYEITNENYKKIIEIENKSKCVFLDLCPLIYETDADIVNAVLLKTDILSGTAEEFQILCSKLNAENPQELLKRYGFDFVLIKMGANGAKLLKKDEEITAKPENQFPATDTTGCGDTFNAAVISAFCDKKSDSEMLRYAVACASAVAQNGFDPMIFK